MHSWAAALNAWKDVAFDLRICVGVYFVPAAVLFFGNLVHGGTLPTPRRVSACFLHFCGINFKECGSNVTSSFKFPSANLQEQT